MTDALWIRLSEQNHSLWEAMFNSLWQGVLLVALVWLVLRAFPRLNAATRYAAWYVTLLSLAIMPFFTGRFAGVDTAGTPEPERVLASSRPHEVSPPTHVEQVSATPATFTQPRRSAPAPKPSRPAAAQGSPVREHQIAGSASADNWAVRVNGGTWLWVLSFVWLVCVGWKWLRLGGSLRQIRLIKSRAQVMDESPGRSWHAWCREVPRSRRVWLGWSDEIQVPGVFGFVRPAILFPRRLQGTLSEAELEQVALHELAHVARHDDWWQILQRVIEGALFFHPAVRFVSQRLALEREIACDDWVLHRVRRPQEYASCLARLVEHRSARPLPVPGAALSRKHIVRRIEMLLSKNRNTRPGLSRAVTALSIMWLALAVIQIGFVRPIVAVTEPTPVAAPSPVPAVSSPRAMGAPTPAPAIAPSAPRAVGAPTPTPALASVAPRAASAPTPRPDRSSSRQPRAYGSRDATAPVIWAQATPAPPAPPAPPVKRKGNTQERWDDGTSLTINHDGDEITWIWSDGPQKVRVEMDGRVEFDAQGATIRSISPDGYFIVREKLRGRIRELEVVPGRKDSLEYFYFEDDDARPFDESARRWFAELLPTLMRETGLGAKERVAALKAAGGTSAVLREISYISSDYVKRIYFTELLDSESLSQDDMTTIFHAAGKELDSDYEMAELLIEFADRVEGNAATLDAYVDAVGRIESDYEMRRVITELAKREDMTEEYAKSVLELAWGMESDYEKAELLLELAEYSRDNPELRDLYVDAVASMQSDYEKRRVLEELLETRHADEAFVSKVLDVAGTMESEYEQAELLIHLADLASVHDSALTNYIRAVDRIDSDYEARRVLSAISWREDLSEAVSLELLDVVARLDSDYEKAEFLLEHSEMFATTDAVRDAFDRTLDTIDSDYERDRVEAAFYRKTRKSGSRGGSY